MAKLLFVQNLEYEFLGPMYISSALKNAGHACRLALGDAPEDFFGEIEAFRPDVVAFSIMTGSHRWALGVARALKERYGVLTLFGGAHTTFFPEFVREEGVDVICRGEGEEACGELLGHLEAGTDYAAVPNLWVKRDGEIRRNEVRPLAQDLDALPFPDRELYRCLDDRTDRSVVQVVTSRGCPFRCTFCFEDSMRELYRGKGTYVRTRSPENVLAELRELKAKHGARVIYFCDDVFGVNRQWLYRFLEPYRAGIGLEFLCLVRADIVCSDEAYAGKLKAAGCRSVFFGIETGSETLRNTVLRKNLSDEQIYRAADLLHGAGLRFRTYNILGLPDETLADAWKTLEMNIRIKADFPWCSIFAPYPGTALAAYAQEKGYLAPGGSADDIPRSFFIDSRLRLPDAPRIENVQKFFQTAVLWPRTLPLVKSLVRLPPNPLFRLWFGLVYFLVYLRSEHRGFWKTLVFAARNWRHAIVK